MSPETLIYTAEMVSTAGRDGRSNRPDGSFPLKLTVPEALGGPGGEGTNPEELFAAGYSACFIGALKVAGRQAKQPVPEDVQVTAKVGIGKVETGYGLAVELIVDLPGMDRDTAQSLIEQAHRTCPYSNATRGNIDVKLTLA
ncbi:organic hydroperoxide resistance protein [Paracoccus aurantiacus]|uniref:Organic hydroperoxide resistance protein n=1 Tax=Paracoccus aurantiacus TaxID=2599412 RepID=A0A5C6S0D4_9RHOB|nr:organic hydroperoxide resistance protein [Paracoccus aurantiacus]TXB67725.1 organic hydroperoxide resistance protein [Paracoccus aurantiacus]